MKNYCRIMTVNNERVCICGCAEDEIAPSDCYGYHAEDGKVCEHVRAVRSLSWPFASNILTCKNRALRKAAEEQAEIERDDEGGEK